MKWIICASFALVMSFVQAKSPEEFTANWQKEFKEIDLKKNPRQAYDRGRKVLSEYYQLFELSTKKPNNERSDEEIRFLKNYYTRLAQVTLLKQWSEGCKDNTGLPERFQKLFTSDLTELIHAPECSGETFLNRKVIDAYENSLLNETKYRKDGPYKKIDGLIALIEDYGITYPEGDEERSFLFAQSGKKASLYPIFKEFKGDNSEEQIEQFKQFFEENESFTNQDLANIKRTTDSLAITKETLEKASKLMFPNIKRASLALGFSGEQIPREICDKVDNSKVRKSCQHHIKEMAEEEATEQPLITHNNFSLNKAIAEQLPSIFVAMEKLSEAKIEYIPNGLDIFSRMTRAQKKALQQYWATINELAVENPIIKLLADKTDFFNNAMLVRRPATSIQKASLAKTYLRPSFEKLLSAENLELANQRLRTLTQEDVIDSFGGLKTGWSELYNDWDKHTSVVSVTGDYDFDDASFTLQKSGLGSDEGDLNPFLAEVLTENPIAAARYCSLQETFANYTRVKEDQEKASMAFELSVGLASGVGVFGLLGNASKLARVLKLGEKTSKGVAAILSGAVAGATTSTFSMLDEAEKKARKAKDLKLIVDYLNDRGPEYKELVKQISEEASDDYKTEKLWALAELAMLGPIVGTLARPLYTALGTPVKKASAPLIKQFFKKNGKKLQRLDTLLADQGVSGQKQEVIQAYMASLAGDGSKILEKFLAAGQKEQQAILNRLEKWKCSEVKNPNDSQSSLCLAMMPLLFDSEETAQIALNISNDVENVNFDSDQFAKLVESLEELNKRDEFLMTLRRLDSASEAIVIKAMNDLLVDGRTPRKIKKEISKAIKTCSVK